MIDIDGFYFEETKERKSSKPKEQLTIEGIIAKKITKDLSYRDRSKLLTITNVTKKRIYRIEEGEFIVKSQETYGH